MAVGVIITDSAGANAVTFSGASEPYPIPMIARYNSNQTVTMRPGASATGTLVSRLGGARFRDAVFDVAYLTQAMVDSLLTKIATYPAVPVRFSVDAGATYYYATFADGEEGFNPSRWESDSSRYKASFRLHIHKAV